MIASRTGLLSPASSLQAGSGGVFVPKHRGNSETIAPGERSGTRPAGRCGSVRSSILTGNRATPLIAIHHRPAVAPFPLVAICVPVPWPSRYRGATDTEILTLAADADWSLLPACTGAGVTARTAAMKIAPRLSRQRLRNGIIDPRTARPGRLDRFRNTSCAC